MSTAAAAPVASASIDSARLDAFAQKLFGIVNGAGLAMMISLGHRSRLFDVMSTLPAATSHQIAERAGLNERYVREWLGAMVTGGIVEYEPAGKTFTLPAEHAALLTRAATPNNFGVVAQFVSVLGAVEDDVLECFHRGGGVPYEKFRRFHEVMAEESGQTVVAALEEHVLPLAPGLREKLERGIDVLDVGCGSGRAMNLLAALFPNSRFRGYDVSAEAIGYARKEAAARGLSNVRFEVRDVTNLGEKAAYDLITAFDAIHDQPQPAAVLAGISAALRDDGLFLMQDIRTSSHLEKNIDHPVGPFLYTISTMHCMTVSLASCGCGLGTCWGTELATRMLQDAGFAKVEVRELPHDIQNAWFLARKR